MSLKRKLFSNVKKVGQAAANVVQYTAPVAGSLLGPLGAAAGTAVGAAAATVGAKNKQAAVKRELAYGGSIVAGTAALGLISGSGIGAGSLTSLGSLFGGRSTPGASVARAQEATSPLSVAAQGVPTTPGGGLSPAGNLAAFGTLLGTATGTPNAPAVGSGIPSFGDAEGQAQQPNLLPIILIGSVIVLAFMSRKK